MTRGELDKALGRIPGVSEANAMQRRVWGSRSQRIIVISPTGSGKTVAFAGILLLRIKAPDGSVQAVVLAPSRELVIQIAEVVRRLAADHRVVAFYGQHSMADEVNSLRTLPDIIVATPGRLLDHLQRGTLHDLHPRVLAIDEYDKALELGFLDQMRRIAARIGNPHTVILTSATPLHEEHRPRWLDMDGAETIESDHAAPTERLHIARIESPARDKLDTLTALLERLGGRKTIVFVNHREAADRLADALRRRGIPVGLYHGGLEQQLRDEAVIRLANGTAPVLIATDLAARGLDIPGVEAVVHYHMPPSAEAWTHRNGRTARVDARGDVYVITSEADTVPDYVTWQHDFDPAASTMQPAPWPRAVTLYFDAGRREKISRADIVGFLTKQAGIPAEAIGRIDLRDHNAYAAVGRDWLGAVEAAKGQKLKNRRVRISPLK